MVALLLILAALPGTKLELPLAAGKDPAKYVTGSDINAIVSHARSHAPLMPEDFGAACDGVTDDGDALQDMVTAAEASGALIAFPDAICLASQGLLVTKGIHIRGTGRKSVLRLVGSPVHPANQHIRAVTPLGPIIGTATGDLAAGARTLTLTSVAGISAGDTLFLRLGPDPYDANEEQVRMFNVVESVVGSTVTFRVGWPEDIGDATHEVNKPTSIVDGLAIEGLTLDFADGVVPDRSIQVFAARNVTIRNIFMPKSSTGVSIEESENVTVDGLYVTRADRTLHTAAGRLFGAWGSRNVVVRNVYGFDIDRGIFLESQNRGVLLENITLLSGSTSLAIDPAVNVRGGSRGVVIRGFTFGSGVARPAVYVTQGAEVRQEDITLLHGAKASAVGELTNLTYKGVRYDRRQKFSRTFQLVPGLVSWNATLPSGIYLRARVYVSTKTGITSFAIANTSGFGGGNMVSSLVAGATVEAPVGLGTDYLLNEEAAKRTQITTDSAVPAGAWGAVEIDYLSASGDEGTRAHVSDLTRFVKTDVLDLGVTVIAATAAPTSGAWRVGDRVLNSSPAVGQPQGWVCTVAGSPGTWVSEGNL